MRIEHAPVVIEFAAFRFATSVDGVPRYETVGDHLEGQWHTRRAGTGEPVPLRGPFSPSRSDDATAARIQPEVERAITEGRNLSAALRDSAAGRPE